MFAANVRKVLHPKIRNKKIAYVKKVLNWIKEVNIKSYLIESHQLYN